MPKNNRLREYSYGKTTFLKNVRQGDYVMVPRGARPIEQDGQTLEPGVKYLVDGIRTNMRDTVIGVALYLPQIGDTWNFYDMDTSLRIRICARPTALKPIIIIEK
jgi:hypothetical protein